ncbi:MAG: mechanosensitive ion channel family protein [Clostridiales bacterium]|nr:mechanosensitive ion channel family protein [Clostridiales bacterium]
MFFIQNAFAAATADPVISPTPSIVEAVSEGVEITQKVLGLPPWLTRLALAAVSLLVGILLLRTGKKIINNFFRNPSKISKSSKTLRQRETFASLVTSVFSYLMYFIIIVVVLGALGVDIAPLIAVAGVGGVAVGFGAQTLVKDIISGIFLWSEGNITVGEKITVNNMHGTVENVSLRTTSIRDYNGDLYVIPNGDIRTVINTSRNFKRAIIDMRLNYEEDLSYMLDVLQDEMRLAKDALPELKQAPQIMGINAIQGDCIIVRISALCSAKSYAQVERELRKRLLLRFKKEQILVPHGPIMQTPRLDQLKDTEKE